MKLLLYAKTDSLSGKRIGGIIEGLVPNSGTERCENVAGLTQRLRQRTGDLTLVVLCVSSPEELEAILDLRCWLQDLRILLLLPDRTNGTLARGLTLRPRFLGYADTDLADVAAVLERMLSIYGEPSVCSREIVREPARS